MLLCLRVQCKRETRERSTRYLLTHAAEAEETDKI